jgi:hypothetical protein
VSRVSAKLTLFTFAKAIRDLAIAITGGRGTGDPGEDGNAVGLAHIRRSTMDVSSFPSKGLSTAEAPSGFKILLARCQAALLRDRISDSPGADGSHQQARFFRYRVGSFSMIMLRFVWSIAIAHSGTTRPGSFHFSHSW